MSGATSGAYCQEWTAIRGATGICDAVFIFQGARLVDILKIEHFKKSLCKILQVN